MGKSFEDELNKIKKQLRSLKINFDIEPTEDINSVVIANQKSEKAAIVGEVDINEDSKVIVAYMIDVRKWYWAEQEGFTRNQILSCLAHDVFTPVSPKKVAALLK